MRVYYPRTRDAGWDLSGFKYLVIYLYSENDDPDLRVKLKEDDDNYYEAAINHLGGAWRRYEILLSTMRRVGNPSISEIGCIEIETDAPSICIDSDHVFVPAMQEQLTLRFTLSRSSPDTESPRVKLAKFVWREG